MAFGRPASLPAHDPLAGTFRRGGPVFHRVAFLQCHRSDLMRIWFDAGGNDRSNSTKVVHALGLCCKPVTSTRGAVVAGAVPIARALQRSFVIQRTWSLIDEAFWQFGNRAST